MQLDVLKTPFCGDLRSKKYYMSDQILTQAEDYHDASGHTYCYHTQMPIGPDGSRAAPEYCTAERGCYRSAFEEPAPYKPPPRPGTVPPEPTLDSAENPEV
jgi:hypothetical protein